ncbi:unnamed protein product [Diatraea saccharalis]|uniref:DUF4806 domain-containing protein n=1 Tax=Diatraea saccharalis TaxID=40085 RepID=A0A9N9WF02_9NEOP|nr:unnamed protein product [Diatraea saccharalis]
MIRQINQSCATNTYYAARLMNEPARNTNLQFSLDSWPAGAARLRVLFLALLSDTARNLYTYCTAINLLTMSFKIVKSLEKGVYRHWIVPSSWEHDNNVKWPKKNISELVKCIDSVPEPDWLHIKCQVKRSNIPTYKEADRELSRLLNVTDTDEDDFIRKITMSNQKEVNMNSAMEQLADQDNPPMISVPEESYESSSQIILTADNQILGIPTNTYCVLAADQEHFIDKPKENCDLYKSLENINLTLGNHNRKMDTILENKKKIMYKMACLSIQVDNVQLQLGNVKEDHIVPLSAVTKNKVENMGFSFSPITTVEELIKINDSLSNKTARKRLKETLSVVCSGGKGNNCAYKLIDIMFSRDFLYNELFLKSVLKNSNKRKNAKQARSSTTRKRAKIEKNETGTKPNDDENNAKNDKQDANKPETTSDIEFAPTAKTNVKNQPSNHSIDIPESKNYSTASGDESIEEQSLC